MLKGVIVCLEKLYRVFTNVYMFKKCKIRIKNEVGTQNLLLENKFGVFLKKDHKKWIDFPRNPVQNVHLLNTQYFDFSNQFLPSAKIDTVKKATLDRNRKYMIFLPQFNSRLTILQFFRPFKLFTIIKKHHVGSYCLIIILF